MLQPLRLCCGASSAALVVGCGNSSLSYDIHKVTMMLVLLLALRVVLLLLLLLLLRLVLTRSLFSLL